MSGSLTCGELLDPRGNRFELLDKQVNSCMSTDQDDRIKLRVVQVRLSRIPIDLLILYPSTVFMRNFRPYSAVLAVRSM